MILINDVDASVEGFNSGVCGEVSGDDWEMKWR